MLRAGTLGREVLWRRGGEERSAAADGLWGPSPCFAAALVQRLALQVGQVRDVRLLEVTEPVLAAVLVDRRWARTAEDRWEETDLATGERRTWTAEDLTLTRP